MGKVRKTMETIFGYNVSVKKLFAPALKINHWLWNRN